MDMHSKNQYLKELQQKYLMSRSRKEKSSILDEYCRNTHQNRKYIISKINSSFSSKPKKAKKRKQIYEGKKRGQEAVPSKKQTPRTVTNYMIQQPLTGLPH